MTYFTQPFAAPTRQPTALLPGLLAALPDTAGRAAVLLPAREALRMPSRRRMAETLLEDAARSGGGDVYRTTRGEALLLGTAPAVADRVAARLAKLVGEDQPVPVWLLQGDATRLLAWAEGQILAPNVTPPVETLPAIAGLTATLDKIATDQVLRADTINAADGPVRGRWLRLSRSAIAAAVEPLGDDPDMVAYAADRLAARLLPGLGAWAAGGTGLRLVPLPFQRWPPTAQPGAIAVAPLALAGYPALATLRSDLAARGWQLAFSGLGAAALGRLRLAELPADLLLLRWSPAMGRVPSAAISGVSSAKTLVLTGADAEGRDWAARCGIALFAGPAA